jgi:tetratricopeptide (TPR) repeat protein
MSDAFLSSDEYDERARHLYHDGRYDDALALLKEGLSLYPHAVDLHVGLGYAQLAVEEYAWARHSFEAALMLEPEHEDALAGLGEALLKLGRRAGALAAFERVLALRLHDDLDLMLQIGRALFREGLVGHAHRFFELAAMAHPESADAAACLGYATHRLGREGDGFYWLLRALALDPQYVDARIYLGNALYDRGEVEAALRHFERTRPEDHVDELALWRTIELKKTIERLADDDPDLVPWYARLAEIAGDLDPVEEFLAEVEGTQPDGSGRDPHQLELFGALVSELPTMRRFPPGEAQHMVVTLSGQTLRGSWDEILEQLKESDRSWSGGTLAEFMAVLARQGRAETGVVIPTTSAEAFLRGSAEAGVLRIVH